MAISGIGSQDPNAANAFTAGATDSNCGPAGAFGALGIQNLGSLFGSLQTTVMSVLPEPAQAILKMLQDPLGSLMTMLSGTPAASPHAGYAAPADEGKTADAPRPPKTAKAPPDLSAAVARASDELEALTKTSQTQATAQAATGVSTGASSGTSGNSRSESRSQGSHLENAAEKFTAAGDRLESRMDELAELMSQAAEKGEVTDKSGKKWTTATLNAEMSKVSNRYQSIMSQVNALNTLISNISRMYADMQLNAIRHIQ